MLELLSHVASAYAGTDAEALAAELRGEVTADRKELEKLMEALEISQSATRKASAWVGEKLGVLKLKVDDLKAGALRLLEATDAMSVGIEGKRLLWVALRRAAGDDPRLRVLDYDRLEERALDQRRRVENLRLKAAAEALADQE